jgi:cardiolipin synthase
MLRILLVLPCAYAFYLAYYKLAIGIFVLASATDCIDGFLARKLSCQTKLGAILDPLADKFLIVALFFVLTIKNFIPFWFAGVIILREFILLSGAAYYRFMFGPVIFVPTMLSKINTCLLLFLLLVVLSQAMLEWHGFYFNTYLMVIILITSISSGLVYIYRWCVKILKLLNLNKLDKLGKI